MSLSLNLYQKGDVTPILLAHNSGGNVNISNAFV